MSASARWLAQRVRPGRADAALRLAIELSGEPLPAGMLDAVAERLHAGETHYTNRPGIIELRELLAARILDRGGPRLEAATEIVVTASEGEALFVALLAHEAVGGEIVARHAGGRHRALFEFLAIDTLDPDNPATAGAQRIVYVEHPATAAAPGGEVALVNVGDLLGRNGAWPAQEGPAIALGDLDALPGMDALRIGFAAGPADLMKRVMSWKQAFSICTAAPSQRAAIWALEHTDRGDD